MNLTKYVLLFPFFFHPNFDDLLLYILMLCIFCWFKLSNILENYITMAAAWNPGGLFLIMLNNPELRIENSTLTVDSSKVAMQFFSLMYRKYNVANVVFCFSTGIQTYDIFMTDPYRDPVDCGMYITLG